MSLETTPLFEFAIDIDAHQFWFALQQALGSHDHFHFAGADAEGDGAEGAVRGGMAVAADDGHTGLGDAEFGSDDVHDALVGMAEAV